MAAAVDFLQIDAVFMPVNKVNYSVEDARIDGSLEKDRLLLEIWTNGSLTPQEALSQAASTLVELFNPLKISIWSRLKMNIQMMKIQPAKSPLKNCNCRCGLTTV
jgi:DNA-directed RNA polymerase subunit alpha